jgi:hypothetical protein
MIFASCILTFYLTLNLPVFFWHFAGHDDGLFMSGASHILESGWLGPYNQYILSKGPTYSVFLALASLSGLPINFVHTAFQIFAIFVTSHIVLKLANSKTVATITFIILSLSPVTIMPDARRIIRDQIYWPLSFLVFASFVAVLFIPMKTPTRIAYAIAAGAIFGLTWLTREEGIWFLPGLAILAVGAFFIFWNSRNKKLQSILALTVVTIAFIATNCLFYSINYLAYGSFSGVDFKERNFTRLVNGLQSINVGPVRPFVSVTLETRRAVAEVVPTFKPLQQALEPGQPLFAWQKASCNAIPSTCGEIGGGWFLWALRDAAAQNKFYTSPVEASRKYGKISDDIEAACANGHLKCKTGFINYLPAMTKEQWFNLPLAAFEIAKLMIFINVGGVKKVPIASSTETNHLLFVDRWEMLNRPLIYSDGSEMTIEGWLYDPNNNGAPELVVQTLDGKKIESQLSRINRPDLVVAFKDIGALYDGFTESFICPAKCEILATTNSKTLTAQLTAGNHVSLGNVQFHLDQVTTKSKPVSLSTQFSLFILVDVLIPIYKIFNPALVLFGLCAFVIALTKSWRYRILKPTLVAAFAAYSMVASRIIIMALIEISSFPATSLLYTMPGNYLIILASILSIASCSDFFQQLRHKVQSPTKQ